MFSKAKSLFQPKADARPVSITPETPKFSEASFIEEFGVLLESEQPEDALDFFLSQVGDLAASGIHRRIKLNHLRYAARILETRTSAKHGFEKLRRKLRSIKTNLKDVSIPSGTFLDFGCGEHDPLALASVYYLNGFERAIACDLREPHVPAYSAFSMFEILANMRAFPQPYLLPDTDPTSFTERLGHFDLQPLFQRDFDRGVSTIAGKVDYRLDDVVNLDVEDETLALTVSFAVLEHVLDPDNVYEWLFRKTKPGGIQFHFVDLADHRSYTGTGEFNRWSFLTEEEGPETVNRMRASEHRQAFEKAGFEILNDVRSEMPIPPETKERLLSPWSDCPDDEINAINIRLVLRRPI